MAHEYSKFKNKNIPYAKVGRRVFNSLFDAETFCTEHSLDVNSAIEYRDDSELKNNIQTIAQYQKAILQECEGCANINRPWNDSVCGHCSRLNDQRYDAYQKKG